MPPAERGGDLNDSPCQQDMSRLRVRGRMSCVRICAVNGRQEVRMRESGPNSRKSRGRISRVKQMSGKKTAKRRSGSSRTGLLEGDDDRRNKTLGCFRGTNGEETKVFLRSPVSQDREGVAWNWSLCRERFDGTHTMLLRAPGADGPRSCQVRGRCEQLLAAVKERSRQEQNNVHEG